MPNELGTVVEANVIGNINDPEFAEQMREEQLKGEGRER